MMTVITRPTPTGPRSIGGTLGDLHVDSDSDSNGCSGGLGNGEREGGGKEKECFGIPWWEPFIRQFLFSSLFDRKIGGELGRYIWGFSGIVTGWTWEREDVVHVFIYMYNVRASMLRILLLLFKFSIWIISRNWLKYSIISYHIIDFFTIIQIHDSNMHTPRVLFYI